MSVWWFVTFNQNAGWLIAAMFPVGRPLSVTWSLAIEEQFYLVLPALVAFLPQRWLVRVLWTCVVVSPLWRYGLFHLEPLAAFLFLPCRLDALMGGTLIACFTRRYAQSGLLWAALAVVAPAPDLALNWIDAGYDITSLSVVALAFSVCLWLVVRLPPMRLTVLRPLAWLGIGAYSVYLFHMPILSLTGSPALAIPVTLAMAWAFWHYIETPLIRFARTRWRYGCIEKCEPQPVVAI
jgi:peptidoglycan/LPS O-acetylase OafA/YrhL